jgi:hypothetical protein
VGFKSNGHVDMSRHLWEPSIESNETELKGHE